MLLLMVEGKIGLVTGAGQGIGRAIALEMARQGAAGVAVVDRSAETAAETAELAREAGADAEAIVCDLRDRDQIEAMVAGTVARFGGLDVLVNNAAAYAGIRRAPFWEIEEDEWERVVRVNLTGAWRCAKACVPAMRAGGGGAIVNVASAAVLSGSPLWSHYVASKGGLVALTRTMAREAGDLGIRVNAIAPGFTLTDASRALIPDAETYGVERGAIKRAATPADIVGTALYLASPASAFVTGQTIVVDGGRQFL
jgi:NAD(P)-dependent dehydrogenase (short-subunit alcohol dehydrogenase family)